MRAVLALGWVSLLAAPARATDPPAEGATRGEAATNNGPRDDEAVPRFEMTVEAPAPDASVREQFLRQDAPDCAPAPDGPPVAHEMQEFRPGPPPALNFFGAAKALARALKKKRPEYFVYRRVESSVTTYIVRKGPLPDHERHRENVTIELVDVFRDRDAATRAWARLGRGLPHNDPAALTAMPCAPRR